jgi:hypothetical protein
MLVDRATRVPFRDARERAQRAFSLDDQPHISAVLHSSNVRVRLRSGMSPDGNQKLDHARAPEH